MKICHLSYLLTWHQYIYNLYHSMQTGNVCLVWCYSHCSFFICSSSSSFWHHFLQNSSPVPTWSHLLSVTVKFTVLLQNPTQMSPWFSLHYVSLDFPSLISTPSKNSTLFTVVSVGQHLTQIKNSIKFLELD